MYHATPASGLPARDFIKILHQLTVVVVNGLNKFYPKEYIGAALVEAVKFCAPQASLQVTFVLCAFVTVTATRMLRNAQSFAGVFVH